MKIKLHSLILVVALCVGSVLSHADPAPARPNILFIIIGGGMVTWSDNPNSISDDGYELVKNLCTWQRQPGHSA